MKFYREIEYTTTKIKGDLTAGKTCYQGQQVMLDRDLAAICQVLTKRLNEQVRRNIERFPDEFMFQLTKDEMNELVANCDRFKTMKHSSVATLDMLAKRGRGVKVELVTHSNGEWAA